MYCMVAIQRGRVYQGGARRGGRSPTMEGRPILTIRSPAVRVYHITFTATAIGGACTGTLTVGVPVDQGANGGPIDEGALYDSRQP